MNTYTSGIFFKYDISINIDDIRVQNCRQMKKISESYLENAFFTFGEVVF